MAKYRSNSKKDRYQPSRSSGQKKGGGRLGEVEWQRGEVRGHTGRCRAGTTSWRGGTARWRVPRRRGEVELRHGAAAVALGTSGGGVVWERENEEEK